jgi:hypothetical protein
MTGPPERDHLFPQLLPGCRRQARAKPVNVHQFVAKRPRDIGEHLPRPDHDAKIRCLIAHHIRELCAGAEDRTQVCQVARHAAEVEPRNAMIEALEPGGLAQLKTTLLDSLGDARSVGVQKVQT